MLYEIVENINLTRAKYLTQSTRQFYLSNKQYESRGNYVKTIFLLVSEWKKDILSKLSQLNALIFIK